MKTIPCLMILPLLVALNLARADGMPDAVPAASASEKAPARERVRAHKPLPRGDIRHCLDRKTNEAIIRCAETRRKP
jgi:hypothetical protein